MSTRFVLCGGVTTWDAIAALRPVRNALIIPWASHDALGAAAGLRSYAHAVAALWPGAKAALAAPWDFPTLIAKADTVVLPGGDTPVLVAALKMAGFRSEWLRGKQVLANSAGVSALTTRSYNSDHKRLLDGLGIVPRASIVHYDSGGYGRLTPPWDKIVAHLERHSAGLELLLLREGEHAIIEQE